MIEIEPDLEAKVEGAQVNLPKSTDLTSTTQMKEVPKKNADDVPMYTHMENKIAKQLGKSAVYVRSLVTFNHVARRKDHKNRLR